MKTQRDRSITFSDWCASQQPAKMPFRPGSVHTEEFGLRPINIGSPFHTGTDRGSEPPFIEMPFHEGSAEWSMLPDWRDWGSFLRISPDWSPFGVEIHVAHTVPSDTLHATEWSGRYFRGDRLPCIAGDIGLSKGRHTHTELVVEDSEDRRSELMEASTLVYVIGGKLQEGVSDHIAQHCETCGLGFRDVVARFEKQIEQWGIVTLTDRFALRDGSVQRYPDYRVPRWGRGSVLIVDIHWALDL